MDTLRFRGSVFFQGQVQIFAMTHHEKVDMQNTPLQELRESTSGAFREFFMQSFPAFFTFAASFVADKRSAKNIAAESFFLLWKMWRDFHSEENARAFLYTSIRNNCLSYLRYCHQQPGAPEYARNLPDKTISSSLPSSLLQELLAFADQFAPAA
jgi:DNA-directed RNA polymerase specialized sigma24 family protein